MTKWFTSDWHLGHKTIFDFTDRLEWLKTLPSLMMSSQELAESTEAPLAFMQSMLFHSIIVKIRPDDEIYFLGDMAFTGPARQQFLQFVDGLECSKKVLVSGNHDKTWKKHNQSESQVFDEVYTRGEWSVINIKGKIFYLSHLPAEGHMDERDWSYEIPSEIEGYPPVKGTYLPEHHMYPIICGHVHDKWRVWNNAKEECWQFNCGVDANMFKPVSEQTIFEAWQQRHVQQFSLGYNES